MYTQMLHTNSISKRRKLYKYSVCRFHPRKWRKLCRIGLRCGSSMSAPTLLCIITTNKCFRMNMRIYMVIASKWTCILVYKAIAYRNLIPRKSRTFHYAAARRAVEISQTNRHVERRIYIRYRISTSGS